MTMRRPHLRKSSVATIAAATALVVATGGTGAYAAHLITSKQIKNETIKSIDVRNGTLTAADLAPGTIPAPYGGSYAYSTYHDGAIGVATTNTNILTLTVPSAGSYVASAVTAMGNSGAAESFVSCSLVADGDNDVKSVYVEKFAVDSPNRVGYSMQVVHTFGGPGTVRLVCNSNTASGITAANSKITAIKVDHLTNTPG
jgi:hypothetical protein